MDLQQILAAILNPGGTQQVPAMVPPPMASGYAPPAQVGDHNNPAMLQQQILGVPQRAPTIQAAQSLPPLPDSLRRAAMTGPAAAGSTSGDVQGGGMAPAAPTPALAPASAPQGGLGGFIGSIIAPQRAAQNRTVQWLQSQGLDAGSATVLAADKPSLRAYILQKAKGGGLTEFDQRAEAARQYGLDPTTPEGRTFILTGNVANSDSGQTSDMKEYDAAVKQGFKGSLMDFMVKMKEAGRNQVNIDTGTKLPAGFMWKDPNNQAAGVTPIPGGPATQIPAEAAGRIGLADTFLKNFDTIRKDVAGGQVTGIIDAFTARNDSSSAGAETFRKIQTGVDSLQRMLTGAGMPSTEAAQYAYRYLPTYTDDANSMVAKLDRLKTELESIQNRVMQGRGGAGQEQSGNDGNGGWTDLGGGVRVRKLP